MRRSLVTILTFAAALVPVAGAQARVTEIGQTGTRPVPSCTGQAGDNCSVVSRITGVQYSVGTIRNLMVVPRSARLVAWTVRLGRPSRSNIDYFTNASVGTGPTARPGLGLGASAAHITVLRAVRRRNNNYNFRVVAQSPDRRLRGYFGTTVQFPLAETLSVRRGDLIALTVPTWAPVLATGQSNSTTWRASRGKPCTSPAGQAPPQNAQVRVGQRAQYFCTFRTARLMYFATLVSTP